MTPDNCDPIDALEPARDAGDPWFYWAEPDGREIAGLGDARRQRHHPDITHDFDWSGVETPKGPTFLTVAFDRIDDDGPWAGFAPIELITPRRMVRRDRPSFDISPPDAELDVEPKDYPMRVAAALRAIDVGLVDKVVVARVHDCATADPLATLRALRAAFPTCWIFGRSNGVSTFLGATPERLVSVRGRRVEALALAGSMPRGVDGEEDEDFADRLRTSQKEQREHRWVVDAIRGGLEPHCTRLEVPDTPRVRRLENVQHLQTPISGELRDGVGPLLLVGALHPTPAVCGHPRTDAARLLRELEPFDRGLYAGVVGMLEGPDAELCVGIRSALFQRNVTRLYAGAGIVADSDPESEHRETATKLQAVGRWLRGAR